MKTTPEKLVRRIREVSSLPHIVAQVIAVANNPETSAIDLAQVVENDPALAARVLRTVNSASYGLRVPVTTIVKAISYLGFNEIRKIAITASVAELFQEPANHSSQYDRRSLWKHLVRVGIVARTLALKARLDNFEEVFLAGLLHDLGIILLDQHLHESFNTVLSALREETPTMQVEREIIGFDHGYIGAQVAQKWRFPSSVIDAMKYHHDASMCHTSNKQLVAAVEIANVLCSLKGFTSMGVRNLATPRPETFQLLQLGRNDLRVFWDDLDALFDEHRVLIEI